MLDHDPYVLRLDFSIQNTLRMLRSDIGGEVDVHGELCHGTSDLVSYLKRSTIYVPFDRDVRYSKKNSEGYYYAPHARVYKSQVAHWWPRSGQCFRPGSERATLDRQQ